MDGPPNLGSPISINAEGGLYEHGKGYPFAKKWEVTSIFSGYEVPTSLSNQPTCGNLDVKLMFQLVMLRIGSK
jgi:hypothetical protein